MFDEIGCEEIEFDRAEQILALLNLFEYEGMKMQETFDAWWNAKGPDTVYGSDDMILLAERIERETDLDFEFVMEAIAGKLWNHV